MSRSITSCVLHPIAATMFLGLAAGCAEEPSPPPDPPPAGPQCGAGEILRDGGSCAAAPGLPADMRCPPGQLEVPGEGCQPAGIPPEACGVGFLPDGRGGCEAVLPSEPCPPGQMAIPGESTCRDVSDCGDGTWGDIPADASTEFVDQAYPGADGEGSREKPWKTITAALRQTRTGAIVAIAAGRYEEALILRKRVRLWGRCPRLVEISAPSTELATIDLSLAAASGSEVRSLSVGGAQYGAVTDLATEVLLDRVWIRGTATGGLRATSASGTGTLTVRGSLLEQTSAVGVELLGAGAKIESSVIRDGRYDRTDGFAAGVFAGRHRQTKARARVEIRGTLIERQPGTGVAIIGADGTIESTAVRHTQPIPLDGSGMGVICALEPTADVPASLVLRTSEVSRNTTSGVGIVAATATIEHTTVRGTRTNSVGYGGAGIDVESWNLTGAPSKVDLRASLVEDNQETGVLIIGSEAKIDGVVVRDTQPDSANRYGHGVHIQPDALRNPSSVTLHGSLIERNKSGIIALSSTATVEETIVRDTQPDHFSDYSYGISVVSYADIGPRGSLSVRACLIEQNAVAGLGVLDADATIASSVVRGTRPSAAGDYGDGLMVSVNDSTSTVTLTLTQLVSNARAGGMFIDTAGELSFVQATENRYGLVLQGSAMPNLGEGVDVSGNALQDKLSGGETLAVPNAPLAIP